ncbi:two-component system sensor histidine kinase [Fulvivirga imtechensis AK7]|uniref:histidine kinase n=2 Tax=Fulvivirga TaxID=396811 RepID=L8JSB4_9BACT|nr:two-component system sensor histidine kinase [Fulvivirga imtechensis AK7]
MLFFESYGQKPVWKEYKEVDGMISNYIYDIKEDKNGVLWLATEGGVVKFDGYHAYTVPLLDSLGKHIPVYYVYIMPDQRLWLGTKLGLRIYDPDTRQLVSHTLSFNNPVEDIIYLGRQQVLISYLHGVYLVSTDKNFQPQGVERFDVKHFGENLIVNEFATARNDHLFISLAGYGVIHGKVNELGQWEKYQLINNPLQGEGKGFKLGKNIQVLPANRVLINYLSEGPFIYNLTTGQLEKVPGLNMPNIQTLTPYTATTYADGYLYFSVTGMGLYRIFLEDERGVPEPISFESIPDFNFLDDGISSIYVRNNTLWVATIGDGIKSTRLQDEAIKTIALHEHVGNLTSLNSVKVDSEGNLLVGSFGRGVVYLQRAEDGNFDPKQVEKVGGSLNLPSDSISEFHFDRQGNLWIATYEGLCYYTREQYERFKAGKDVTPRIYSPKYTSADPFTSGIVNDIFEDTGGNIYATTQSGLNMIDPETGAITNHLDSIKKGAFSIVKPMYYGDFLCDSTMVFFSPWVNGIIKDGFFTGNEMLFTDTYDAYIYHSVAVNGISWLGTNRGLYKYQGKTGKTIDFKERPFFKNKKINAITEDPYGTLWMGTNQGIISYHPYSGRIRQYRVPGASGWPFFHYGSVAKDHLGNVYFGTNKGVVIIDTKRIAEDENRCKADCNIMISDILVNDESKGAEVRGSHAGKAVVDVQENDVIDVLLGFPAHHLHDNISFEYSIDDEKWFPVDPVSPRVVLYRLNPGEYNLSVRAVRYGGEVVASSTIPFDVKGPWWKTWWSFIIYSLLAAGLVAAYYRYRLAGVRLKQQLELEKMARINQNLKLDFVSNISHEFRTPLTLILNDIDVLKSNGHSSTPKCLHKIEVNAQRLKRLANELIDMKKLEQEGLKLMVSQYDIIAFVRDTVQVFEELAKKNKIDLYFDTNKKFELIWFNKDQLEKVLFNLLSNAFKFTTEKGAISVSIDCQYRYQNREAIAVTVSDTGTGIADSDIDKVFDASFSRPPLNEASGFESTGIGLHLSQKLVQLHHGELSAASKKGAGSTFTMILYKGSGHFKPDQLLKYRFQHHLKRSLMRFNKEVNRENGGAKILIVEDNKDIRRYMAGVLSGYYTVFEARSGVDGIELAKTKLPDLIITDLAMPGKSGHALIREMKEDEMTSHIPIIVLTAFVSDAKKVEVLSAGADVHLSKPCDKSVLLASAQNLIRSRATLKAMFADSMANIDEAAQNSPDSDLLKRAMIVVNKHMADPYFDVVNLADKLKVSRSLLYLKFPALTNYSPKEFIHVMRVRKGAKLLKSGQYNINEASDEVGYNSVKNFRKYFKGYFGISPSAFLKNNKVKG